MSQSSSQALDPSWVSVPLAKFSHNSSPFGTRNFTWNHVGSRNDLDVVLRNTRIVAGDGHFHNRLFMKITTGTEELEQQDLCELLQHVHSFNPSCGGENPIQVVTKSPFLAMRYPKSANIVRRIQLKFHNDADFTRILAFVKELGLPVTGPVPASTPVPPSCSRPSISPSPSVISESSASASLAAPSMFSVSSVSSSSSRMSLPMLGSPRQPSMRDTNDQISIASDPMIPKFKVPMRPCSSFSEPSKALNSFNYTTTQIPRPATTSNFFPLTALQSSQTYVHPPSSVYIKQMEHESQSHGPSLPSLPVIGKGEDASQPNLLLYQSNIESQNRSISERSLHTDFRLNHSPFFPSQIVLPDLKASIARELSPSRKDQNTLDLATVDFQTRNAALFEAAEQHRLLIPPKRQLPFPKPREAVPRSASVSKFSYSPIPPPIPRPRSSGPAKGQVENQGKEQTKKQDPTPVAKPTKKRVAQRKATVVKPPEVAESPPPPEQASNNVDAITPVILPQAERSPLAAKSFVASSGPASAASGLQSKATSTASKKRAAPARSSPVQKRPKMVDQSTQTETRDGDPAVLQSVQNKTCASAVAPAIESTPTILLRPPERYLDAVDAFVAQHKTRPAPKEIWEQPGWTEADEDERHRILDNFICDNLENKDFIQLCEDTRNSWKRMMGLDR